jgi:hypothetical protein
MQEGSHPTIGEPGATPSQRLAASLAALSRASSSMPLEMLARPQQPLLSSRTGCPAASSSRTTACPMPGSV